MRRSSSFVLMLMVFSACQSYQEIPPNIIFILSDDHALKAISAYDTSLIRTPGIDRLAE